jgi:hypothetical protein
MNGGYMAIGAFLLVLGVTMIAAIPYTILIFGIQNTNTDYVTAEVAFLSVFVASIGGAVLAYGVASKKP